MILDSYFLLLHLQLPYIFEESFKEYFKYLMMNISGIGVFVVLGGLLGHWTVRVSGMAETEQCLGQAVSVTSGTK